MDTGQHLRLSNFKRPVLSAPPARYLPGNEWVSYTHQQLPNMQMNARGIAVYRHDSVIALTAMTNHLWEARLKVDSFYDEDRAPLGQPDSTYSSSRIVLMQVSGGDTLEAVYSPEVMDTAAANNHLGNSMFGVRYFVDTFCQRYLVSSNSFHGIGERLRLINGCLNYDPGVSGFSESSTAGLADFGGIYYHSDQRDNITQPYSSVTVEITYLKMGSCSWGTKIDVPSLAIGPDPQPGRFTFFPNPASAYLTIQGNPVAPTTVSLYDVLGRKRLSQPMNTTQMVLNVADIPTGLYFLEVAGKRRTVHRVSIVH